MKLLAASLLIAAVAVYIVARVVGNGHGGWGYLEAAAEASLVGGLADWFAVTALFRYPLGLPIPHTAIIPRRKDQIGAGLASFVNQYFLTPEVVGDRIAAAQLPRRTGEWLAEPQHAGQVAAELATALQGLAHLLDDDELRVTVAELADKRLREVQIAPLLARVVDALCDSGRHQQLLTAGLRALMRFLDANRAVFRARLGEESPEWVPEWVDDRVFARGFLAVQSFLADVSIDDAHDLRRSYDRQLRAFAKRLREDPVEAARVEQAKLELLDHPEVRGYLGSLWDGMKGWLLDSLSGSDDPDSGLRRSLTSLTMRAGAALRDDPRVTARAEDVLQRVAAHVVTQYGTELAGVISATIERWDADETSRRLELQVGRDLQFIRINGTVVGALAGLAIYTLTQVL
jgi:uncharacterized membrane-anchored protein YjiN (DUF445 family)